MIVVVLLLASLSSVSCEVGQGYRRLVRCLFFPHFSLITSSISNLQLLFFAVVLHSPPTPSRSPLTQSSHRILGLPRLLFPSNFWTSYFFGNFSSTILSTCAANFSLLLTNFFLKLSFTPTSSLSSYILLVSALSSPTILLIVFSIVPS